MPIETYFIAIVGGIAAGILNTLAGNGSAITLTILTELLSLPGNMANGTNRVGIMAQSLVGTATFYQNGKLDLKRGWVYIVPTIIGALIGVLAAISVSSEQFESVFSVLLVVMLFVILVKPKRWLQKTDSTHPVNYWMTIPAFLALGFYGGFIQMGMGVFFLAAMVLGARFSLTDANVIKVFVVGAYTLFVVFIFHWQGLIDWYLGLILAVGQAVGAWLAASFASHYPKADFWAYVLLVVVVIWAIARRFHLFDLIERSLF